MSLFRRLLAVIKRFQASHASVWAGSLTLHMLLGLPAVCTFVLWCVRLVATPAQVVHWLALMEAAVPNEAVQQTLRALFTWSVSGVSSIVVLVIAVFATSKVFSHLALALTEIWSLSPALNKEKVWSRILRGKLQALFSVLIFIVLLACLLSVAILLEALAPLLLVFTALPTFSAHVISLAAFTVFATLFSIAFFYYFSSGKFTGGEYLKGGLLTAVLMLVGQLLLTLYFSALPVASGFGFLGGAVVFLLWMYYTNLAFLFGATTICAFERSCPPHV